MRAKEQCAHSQPTSNVATLMVVLLSINLNLVLQIPELCVPHFIPSERDTHVLLMPTANLDIAVEVSAERTTSPLWVMGVV